MTRIVKLVPSKKKNVMQYLRVKSLQVFLSPTIHSSNPLLLRFLPLSFDCHLCSPFFVLISRFSLFPDLFQSSFLVNTYFPVFFLYFYSCIFVGCFRFSVCKSSDLFLFISYFIKCVFPFTV